MLCVNGHQEIASVYFIRDVALLSAILTPHKVNMFYLVNNLKLSPILECGMVRSRISNRNVFHEDWTLCLVSVNLGSLVNIIEGHT